MAMEINHLREILDDQRYKGRIFNQDFQTTSQWSSFLENYAANFFDEKPYWNENNENNADERAVSEEFRICKSLQALFVACWLFCPIVKGNYMIKITNMRLKESLIEKIRKLPSRSSSHLSGRGYSAAKDFKFIKGYDELLVQIEEHKSETYLYLKMEGHLAFQTEHMLKTSLPATLHGFAYLKKKVTGSGVTRNKTLKELAKNRPDLVFGERKEYRSGYPAKLAGKIYQENENLYTNELYVGAMEVFKAFLAVANIAPANPIRENDVSEAFINDSIRRFEASLTDKAVLKKMGAIGWKNKLSIFRGKRPSHHVEKNKAKILKDFKTLATTLKEEKNKFNSIHTEVHVDITDVLHTMATWKV